MNAGSVAVYNEREEGFSRHHFVGPIGNIDESGVVGINIDIYPCFANEVCPYILSVCP